MISIGVNLLWCCPGEVGGSEEYLSRQLLGLAELPEREIDDLAMTLFTLGTFPAAHPDLAERYPIVPASTDGHRRGVRVAYEHTWLLGRARERHLDLLHHAGGTMPRAQPARGVLTVHDLQYLTYPQFFSRLKLTWLATAVPNSVRRAATITVPSDFVKESVVSAFGYPADLVVVVPHGLDPSVGARPTGEDELRARYELSGPVVLYPAITHPHKNHVVLLRAFAALGAGAGDARLVLLGGAGTAEDEVRAEIEALGVGDRVVRPGRVPAADRDGLYRLATVMAFPSCYEGFGAPVLEAMAAGCPVVASDATAIPEVAGDAAILLDPSDDLAWRDALARLLGDEVERGRLAAAGRARAATFTATASARALVSAYRLALA